MDQKIDDMLRSADLSGEDADRLTKAFKDPEFIKMFGDYVQDLQNPETRAEYEAYLQQLEQEGQTQSVYGKGAQVLLPQPFCVVKTRTSTSDQTAVYINICTSDKLSPYELVPSSDPGRPGRTLQLPNCLGKETPLRTPRDQPARVWDWVVHPAAVAPFLGQPAFQAALIELALEQVERSQKVALLRKWKVMSGITYKGPPGVTKPAPLMYRSQEGGEAHVVGGRFRPLATSDSALAAALAGCPPSSAAAGGGGGAAAGSSEEALKPAAAAAAAGGGGGGEASVRRASLSSSCSSGGSGSGSGSGSGGSSWGEGMAGGFLKRKSWPSGHAPRDPKQPGYQHPDGGVTPYYQLVHRGAADLGEAWGDSGRRLAAGKALPQELVVRVSLPGVTSSATLELEVTATGVHLVLPEKFTLDLPLPHTVDSHKGTAKFDPVKAQLTLTLPVVRPPAKGEGSPTAAAAAGAVGLSVDDSQAAPGAAAGEDATSGDAALQQSAAVTHPTTATAAAGGAPAPTAATATAAAEWPGTPEPHAVAPQPSLSTTSSSSTGTTTSSSGSSSRDEPEGPAAAGPAPAAGGAAAGGPVKTPTQLAWEALHAQQTTNHAATSSSCAAAPAAAGVEAAGGVDGGTGAQQGGSTAGAKHGAATATTTTTTAPQRAAAAAAAAAAATALAAAGLGGHHLPAAAAATGSSGPSSCQTSSTGSGSAVAGTAAGVRLPPRLLGARRLAAALD